MKSSDNHHVVILGPHHAGKTIASQKIKDSKDIIKLDLCSLTSLKEFKKQVGIKHAIPIKMNYLWNHSDDIDKLFKDLSEEFPDKNIVIIPRHLRWENFKFDKNTSTYFVCVMRDPRINWITQNLVKHKIDINSFIRQFKKYIYNCNLHKDLVHIVDVKNLYRDFYIPEVLDESLCVGNQTTNYDFIELNKLNKPFITKTLKIINVELSDEIEFLKYKKEYVLQDFLVLCEKDSMALNPK